MKNINITKPVLVALVTLPVLAIAPIFFMNVNVDRKEFFPRRNITSKFIKIIGGGIIKDIRTNTHDESEAETTSNERGEDIIKDTMVIDNDNVTARSRIGEHKDYLSCFEPRSTPILGTHDMSRILNVGFEKVGSKTISDFFINSGFHTSHHKCDARGGKMRVSPLQQVVGSLAPTAFCIWGGLCIEKQVQENATGGILSNCGNFTIFTQMDFMHYIRRKKDVPKYKCIFPQIHYLNELYEDSPNATWMLPFRNVTKWIASLTHFNKMKYRMKKFCDFPELGFHHDADKEKTDEDFVSLYCNHVKQIRRFVERHPTLSLVEFSIDDPDFAKYLASVFPGVSVSDTTWGHAHFVEERREKFTEKNAAKTTPEYRNETLKDTKSSLSSSISSLSNVSYSDWWQPFVNDMSVTYTASSDKSQWKWCDPPSNVTSSINEDNNRNLKQIIGASKDCTGIYLVKVPKTGSSTAAGISLQIAESVAMKKGLREPCPSHVHHVERGNAYWKRQDPSFIWTSIRQPHKRAISAYFFWRRNRKETAFEYNSLELIHELQDRKHYQFNYISAGMKLQPQSLGTQQQHLSVNEAMDLRKVSSVFQMYDFIAVTERMDESLVVMKLLYDFPDESIIVTNSKISGSFDAGISVCHRIPRSYTTKDVDNYISDHFRTDNLDYLLYHVANRSLDRTIDLLGRERVVKEVRRHRRLRELAVDWCSESIIFPCTTKHLDPPNPKSKESCYYGDWGCGHNCVMDVIRNGTVAVTAT